MKKLKEHTYGTHIYMQLELEGKIYEVDCFFRNDGEHFKTTADGTEEREKVIEAFNLLYQCIQGGISALFAVAGVLFGLRGFDSCGGDLP